MFGKLKLSTYSSLLTNKRTVLVASFGKCGTSDYREAIISWNGKVFCYHITDGYNESITKYLGSNLKSALNIIEPQLTSLKAV